MFQLQQLPCSYIRSWKPRLEGIIMMEKGQSITTYDGMVVVAIIVSKYNENVHDILKQ